MKISSAYLQEHLQKRYEITEAKNITGRDGYDRPLFYEGQSAEELGKTARGHVLIVPPCTGEEMAVLKKTADKLQMMLLFSTKESGERKKREHHQTAVWMELVNAETVPVRLFNAVQTVFDECDAWQRRILQAVREGNLDHVVELIAEMMENSVLVMGNDFSLVSETGEERLPLSVRLFTDEGINRECRERLLQDPVYRNLQKVHETVCYPRMDAKFPSWNRNLFSENAATHRLVITAVKRPLREGDLCLIEMAAQNLEYLLNHEEAHNRSGDLEQIFQRILTDRTADYMQISRQLSAAGWHSTDHYLCLVLDITYVNQEQLSVRAIQRYIRNQMPDSVSFMYREDIVIFLNLTRLGRDQKEVDRNLDYFLKEGYVKAGYSRTIQGHMNLRRQYIQAKTALDVGGRTSPYLWKHHFNEVVLTYILEQSTRRLPGGMICHEGLLRLQDWDRKNHSEYMDTLKAYLNNHQNATHAANALFIHRSTFLYRMDHIREIMDTDLTDPEELFYIELSFYLLEQENSQTSDLRSTH